MSNDLGRLVDSIVGEDPSPDFVSSLRTELEAELTEKPIGDSVDAEPVEVIVLDTRERPETEVEGRKHRGWILVSAAAIVVIVGLVVALLARDESTETATERPAEQTDEPAAAGQDSGAIPTEPAEDVAMSFMNALNAFDSAAAASLVAEDAAFRTDRAGGAESAADFPALYEWYRVTNSVWEVETCTASEPDPNTLVTCTYVLENDITRTVSGAADIAGSYQFVIADGQIIEYWHRFPSASCCWLAFVQFVSDNHPEDVAKMLREFSGRQNDQPVLTPESMALWDTYLEEWMSACALTAERIYCTAS